MSIAPTEWHDGEEAMHKLLRVPHLDNPTTPGLSAHAQRLLHLSSLLAIGIVDDEGRPWTTILGGEQGFARSLGQSIVGVKAVTDHQFDPVLSVLLKNDKSKSTVEGGQNGKDFSALGIHLATRDRVKLQGKMLAGGAVGNTNESKDQQQASSEIQMVFAIAGSLGRLLLLPSSPSTMQYQALETLVISSLLFRPISYYVCQCNICFEYD